MKLILSALVLISSFTSVFARPGPAIPVPKYSATQAIQLSEQEFQKTYAGNKSFMDDCFVISAIYTDTLGERALSEWSWIITIVHPVQNDNSFTYQLKRNGKITLLLQTR